MSSDRKRHYHHSPPPVPDHKRRGQHHRSSSKTPPSNHPKRPVFTSYHEAPGLLPKLGFICKIIATTPSSSVEQVLDSTGLRVSQREVEEVLKLSYGFPGAVVKFFRWAGYQLGDNHSPYAWNLVVDLLGKNGLFDAMWNAIESMRRERLISLATFASVFGSYVIADRFRDAISAFDVMEQYGCPRDTVALNSLLSAVCRDGRTEDAVDFLRVAKARIRTDSDTYAILLEGWEKEGNAACANETFTEMVADIGWDPGNVPAYDSFLITLLKGPNGINETIKFFKAMRERKCFPGLRFFKIALQDCAKKIDVKAAVFIWDSMIGSIGFKPDIQMYNAMIALYCHSNDTKKAMELLDEMVYNGVFPDTDTYSVLFKFLIKNRKLREALAVFNEMTKNEFVPSAANCSAAVMAYMDAGEAYVALKVWKFMIENHDYDLEKTGNFLVAGLRDMDMLPEAIKYAEGMIEKGIKLTSLTLSKLKQSLTKVKKEFVYEDLLRKCRNRPVDDEALQGRLVYCSWGDISNLKRHFIFRTFSKIFSGCGGGAHVTFHQ